MPSDDPTHLVTRLLHAAAEGEPAAMDELIPIVYQHLHSIAEGQMARERKGHTLQTTALVHDAYLRLVGEGGGDGRAFKNREHFYHAAAEDMRRILIEYARRRGRLKRGGDRQRASVANLAELAAEGDFEEIVAVDDAIRRLEEMDARMGRMVRLRFYAGLSVAETASVLGTSERTVLRDWDFARTWLYRTLGG